MIVIAHRGIHNHHFENTYEAIQLAVEHADGVEFDVQLTQCGTPVIFHDESLQRTHALDRALSQLSYKELSHYPFRTPNSSHEYTIPSLEDVLLDLPLDFLINIELKAPRVERRSVGKAVAHVLERVGSRHVIVSSFNPWELLRFSYASPGTKIALLTDPETHPFLAQGMSLPLLSKRNLYSLHPHYSQVTFELMARAEGYKLQVLPWTVNNPIEIERQRVLGVHGIITDEPRVAKETHLPVSAYNTVK